MKAILPSRHGALALCLSVTAHLIMAVAVNRHIEGADMPVHFAKQPVIAVELVSGTSFVNPVAQDSESLAAPAAETSAVPAPEEARHHLSDAVPLAEASADAVSEAGTYPLPAPDVPEARYFLREELAVRPAALNDPLAVLSFEGVPSQVVFLRLFIDEDGNADRVVMEQSFLPESHAERLVAAFYRARFRPGMVDGRPVKSQIRIEVRIEEPGK